MRVDRSARGLEDGRWRETTLEVPMKRRNSLRCFAWGTTLFLLEAHAVGAARPKVCQFDTPRTRLCLHAPVLRRRGTLTTNAKRLLRSLSFDTRTGARIWGGLPPPHRHLLRFPVRLSAGTCAGQRLRRRLPRTAVTAGRGLTRAHRPPLCAGMSKGFYQYTGGPGRQRRRTKAERLDKAMAAV